MAKKSKVARNAQRKALVAKYAKRRAALKARIRDRTLSYEERRAAQDALASLPRDSNPNRVTNRCALTGRPRGNLRRFGLSRIAFREKALRGEIPGVIKSSW
ncbi:ribosomal protein S14 [Myxococcus xanthus DK 1622]|uniref:Small ribosomal subunit protein uS14A n=1 Tax=Myxococcus xanthus (strain DK1622) TaxID=246197 RepID=RS14_MYXXD|nr:MULTISPECIES: 30S ribosomal protein S14 [Myxococcus]Q1CY73.1 RecName: Full=Small ribosomal subunit protein uS14A; AltName: Full=30S ribosomal protein S14 [Myxococcus xanthus DK 1622]ABF88355.1 ribosomal protein S14 [Myxococcus xanthus DK 1622]NOJ56866.1 30S ribosomal protein S14 [Myxococcus xanthus]QPM78862.1 30S ribosomal protein S14 [Myxococcus xanthus]QVW67932.1 30S ribosomal protein S14 [Myxococcus xanthus DZ2]QZZ54151.1 30S ribosomal protein S14 [Myxococcus xanthus]